MNTCIHSASHGTVNSVNTRSAYLPLCISHPHPSAALAPSRLAARRPRSRRPGRARRPSRRSCPSRCPTSPPAPCSRRAAPSLEVGGACIVAGRRPWQTCRGGEPNPACIHEYTVFSRVFSHGSNTRMIRVNTYLKYVFITNTLCIQLCFRYTKIHSTMFTVSGPNTLNTQCICVLLQIRRICIVHVGHAMERSAPSVLCLCGVWFE